MATEGLWTLFIRKTTRVNIRYEVTYTIQSCVTKIEKKKGKDLKIRFKKKINWRKESVCVWEAQPLTTVSVQRYTIGIMNPVETIRLAL